MAQIPGFTYFVVLNVVTAETWTDVKIHILLADPGSDIYDATTIVDLLQ